MSENAGDIYYTVDAKTESAVRNIDNVDKGLGKLQSGFDKTDKAAASTNMQLTKTAAAARLMAQQAEAAAGSVNMLRNAVGGYLSLQGAKTITELADSYTNLQNRLRLITDGQTQLAQATDAVFSIANRTSQAVGTVAEVYQRFGQNAKELGLSQAAVAKVTETVAKAVAISGASAGSAQAALTQFGQALASGTLRGEELNSVMEQTPGLAAAIAKGLGVSIGELRTLAATGAITSQKLIEALGKAADSVDAQFNTRIKTVGQSFVELQNNLQKFVGEASTASGAGTTLANAITLISDNLNTVAAVLTAVGAGALAGYIAKLGVKTVATLADVAATRTAAIAEIAAARAQVASTSAAVAEAAAWSANALTKTQAAARTDALAAAQLRLAAATRAGGTALGLMTSVLGGPIGIISLIATVASGMYLMRDNTSAAKTAFDGINGTFDQTIDKLEKMTESQRKLAQVGAQKELTDATKELDEALNKVARGPMIAGGQTQWAWANYAGKEIGVLNQQLKAGDITASQYDKAVNALADKFIAANNGSEKWRAAMLDLTGASSQAGEKFSTASANSSRLAGALDSMAASARNAAGGLREVAANAGMTGKPGEFLKGLTDGLGRLADNGSKVKEAARMLETWRKEGVAVGSDVEKNITAAAASYDRMSAAQKNAKSGASAANKELNATKQHAEENAKSLNKMAQELERVGMRGEALAAANSKDKLNKWATAEDVKRAQELGAAIYKAGEQEKATQALAEIGKQLALATLEGKALAEAQAVLSLGEYATPQQIESARQLAAQLHDIREQQRLGESIGMDVQKYVTGDVKPLQGGAFDEQAARYAAEKTAEETRYQEQMNRLAVALEAKRMTLQEAFNLEQEMYATHSQRLEQIEQARYTTQLASASGAFGEIAAATKNFAGEQSGMYKAMFAVSKAFAIAEAIVKIQTGIASAAALPFPANIPAMASVAAATAGIVSTISGTSIGAGRQYGGAVQPGKMHRINENGAPEVFNAANGQQFALANTRGEIVSNADATRGASAGGNVIVNLYEDQSRGGEVVQSTSSDNKRVIDIFVADISTGGPAWKSLQAAAGLERQGN